MGRCLLVASLALAAMLSAAGCQKQTAGPKVSDYRALRAAAIAKARQGGKAAISTRTASKSGDDAASDANFASNGQSRLYDPRGKKDPFRSFILERVRDLDPLAKGPLEQFDLSQLSITGVIWEGNRRRAFVMDPAGHGYIVREGDPIGKNAGKVVDIGDNRMLVREAYVDFQGEKTTKEIELRIRQSQGG